ncbi:uncharacterized protein LOC131038678 [Cryptomeria japonica]|uniref:uncharacterized protein LOC131038678 n=1 Tax=Cryptomeria japonica TaxID=3369 RepID=UPI0025AD09FD|nr:uncharacterized protein LOC131038678 [Cryptomeria japonica]
MASANGEGLGSAATSIVISGLIGGLSVALFFAFYLRRKREEVKTAAELHPEVTTTSHKNSKPLKKVNPKSNVSAADKVQARRHHPLDLNTLKGHADAVTGLCFSPDALCLATACADRVVRVFKLDDALSKSFKFLRINMPSGSHPVAVTFCKEASQLVVGAHNISGSSLSMYGEAARKSSEDVNEHSKLPLPEVKWEKQKVHDKKGILTLVGISATYGNADGSTIIASCSEGTDIKLFQGESGKCLGVLDTNQLKNNMASLSPNGRFVAAAAFTADVKVWELVYAKDGSVKETVNVMQLKGHKSAVTWLCFTSDSEKILTASKDGSMRLWNINVRYHLDEDPKCLKVFPIPLHDEKGRFMHYDRLSISPNDKIIAASHGPILQWLSLETGEVLDTADKAHDADITCMAWSPQKIATENVLTTILATCGNDKKVKLWAAPKSLLH